MMMLIGTDRKLAKNPTLVSFSKQLVSRWENHSQQFEVKGKES